MDKIYNVQKNLKRCMKSNRKFSFSMGLLISFLITGGIYTYANEYSHQIFFNGDFNRNVNFDNTLKNFSYPDYPKTLDNKDKYEYFGSYGVKKVDTKYIDFVTFSADLVPKKAPNISLTKPKNSTLKINDVNSIAFDNPNIEDEKINKPQNKPETKNPIKIQKIDRNPIDTITLQNNVDIHIDKIEQITPKNPTYTNISPSKISNDILPQNIDIKFDKRIVAAPKLEDFTPPTPKTPVELRDTGFESVIMNEAYQLLDPDKNIGSERSEYNRGIVGQVSITKGTFKINNVYDDGCYFAYKNYDSIPNYYSNPDYESYKNPIKLNDDNYLKEPKQFDLGLFDSADPDDYLVSEDIYNVKYDDERFRTFYGLNSSAYGYFGKDVDISYISNARKETTNNSYTNKNPNTVIYMETDSNSAQTLENLHNYKVVNDELYNEIKGYKDLSKLKDDDTFEFKKEIFPTGITLFNSEANVKLLGSYAKFVTVTTQFSDERSNKRLSVFNNNGNISALNYTTNEDDDDIKNQIIFYSTPDATPKYSDFQRYIYSNGQKGKINIYSNNAIGMYFTESGINGFQNALSTAFINNGEFNIYGAHSTGVSLKRPATLGTKSGIYLLKPINIFGDEAVGVFLPGDVSKVPEENLQLRVNIGEKGNNKEKVTWNDEFPGNEEGEDYDAEDAEPKDIVIPNVGNTEGNSVDNVDYSIGLFYANSHKANIGLTDIKLGKFAKNSTAIFASDGELHISKGKIDIDGEDNIGLLSQKKDNKSGSIDYVGDIKASGKGNKLAYTDNKNISIEGTVSSTSKDSVSIYADTGTIDLTKADLNIDISGENVAAGYAVNNGKIKLKDESKIKITNDAPSNGTALVAKKGGVIEAKKAKIDIKNIVAGLSASDDNSNIDFTGGTLNYDGEGYSIYTDGKGKINLSDAKITLKGKAIGFDVDQDENSEQNVILNNMTRIKPESDDVILFNLKNSSDLDTKGGIRDHIISRIETKLKKTNPDINLTQLVTQPKAGEPGEFYKVSAMEGGNIKIGSLDKSAVSTDDINGEPDTDEKKAKKDGFQFYNRLHIQRLIATTHDNSTISAILNNSKASKFNNQVVALELSSSPSATSNAETQINIVKSKIIADRTEEGSGAIGLFINYGKIKVDENSTISVENENNVDNTQAVGIYAVNGSEVSNKGEITVGSSNSIGILGENYRKATNNLEKDNFGDGKINISNTGTIEIKGANSTGIYANNTDTGKNTDDNTVVNSGKIIASGEHSNGIYSHKGTVSNTGTIELGDKNVGIYSDSSKINELGTIKFNSNDSTAIFVKGNSTIENGKTLTIENNGDLSGNVGLYSENDLVTDLNINTNGKNITSYYTKSKNLTVNADITTSEDGVGINGDNGSITYEKDKTMKVSHNSFGILSHNSDVTLNGNIQLNSELGKGIYFDSSEKNLNISGNINVNAKNVIGSYIANITDSTKLTLTTPITFGENSDHSIAYLFNKSKFNNTNFTELKSKGTQHNTSIFALSENEINLGDNEVSIKSEDSSKGFNGIYLGEKNKLTGNKITVSDKATGIYSKDNNTVEIKNIEVDGQDTVGIYSEKNTTLNNINISSKNSAVGIYGKEGKITFSGNNILNLSNKGTGIYLEDASLNGGNIKLVNTDTNKENNLVGVYFKDSKSSVNTSNISIDNDTKLIGLYLDNAKVSNKGKIEATSGSSNTLAFVANGSTFKNTTNGTLNLTSSDSHAIYVNNGIAKNTGNITVNNENKDKPSVAMTGIKKDNDVKLTNDGKINVSNNSIGMYLDNGATGNNTKEIVAQKKDSVGVYVNGNTTQFTNTGKISADNIGVYLNKTKEKNITIGNIELINDNAVAVYANDSKVDFEINPIVKEGELPNNLVSLYATGNTEISSKISTANGKNSIGIYLKDKDVSFKDGASVEITEGNEDENGVKYNTGIYADSTYNGDLKVNIENTAKNTIGIAVSKDATVNYSGKITTGKDSIGILAKGNLVTKNSTFTINGGTGIFVDSTADAKIGTDENTIMNLSNKATAIYQNGGKLTLGDKLKFGENSIGTLLISRNAEVDSNISYSVKTDSLGIGLYYTDANNHNFTSNGRITLGSDNATGIYAQSTGTGTNTLKNNGEIITSDGMKNNIGIYADNVNVENNKVSVGENGVGIYLTKKVDLKNTEITLNGEHSVGIYSEEISNGSNYSVGKITSEKDNQTGLFIFNKDYDENKNITLSNLDINLANKSKGVGLQNATYTINEGSKITVGDNSTGLAFKNAKANVKADITVGKNSLALYAQGEKDVTFEGKITADNNSKWVYAKGNANISLNNFDDFTVNGGLGLGAYKATITSNKETKITVNGGTGAYINEGKIDNFKIDVQNGIGLYIQNSYDGTLPNVSLTGDNSKAYILESLNKEFKVNDINLDKTNQIYIYSKGAGKGIKTSNLEIKGSDNYGIYNLANQDILAKDLNISGSKSFGIYSTGTGEINVDKITVTGENSAGVYSINGNITQTGDITSKGLGIYSENGNVTLNGSKILLGDKDGIGVKAKNSSVTISNAMTISNGKEGAAGIYSEGTGDITFENNLVVNKDIIGVYKSGTGTINLNGSSTTILENGIGVYSKGAEVNNAGSLNVTNKNAKGIYVENNKLTSTGTVTIDGENAIGLAGKGGEINSGDISVKGKNAVGIYSDEAKVVSNGKITSNSIGIYSKGSKDITQNGDITIGKDAVGIFKEGSGNVNISSKDVTVGDKGYALYYLNDTNNKGTITANIDNMNLGSEAIGIYTKNGNLTYTGNINVGEKKNSAGIYADNSDVTFKGILNVSKPETIGIFAKGNSNVTIENGSTINVSNGSYGIMTNDGSTGSITIEQGATFNISNLSYGISAYGKNTIINKGTFSIDTNSTGIFHSFDSTVSEPSNIPSDKIKTMNKKANVAGIDIKFNGDVKFPDNIKVVNGGTIKVNGTVDINNMYLDFEHDNKPIIDAKSIAGTAIVKSNFSMGNSVNKLVYKDVFRPRTENGFGKFSGDVTSQSASWVAKISKTEPDTKTYDIMMVRIPYTVMLKGKKNSQLGKSLEEIRSNIPKYTESKIFKDLDNVPTEKELTDTIANIRGDIYSNIQERMLDIDNTFDKSYKEVLDSHNVTDRVHKFSVIYSKNKHIDETLGVSSYDKDSYGILYLNDRENGANKYGFSVGLICSKFNFTGPTSLGSSEEMRSGKFGLHYQRTKDNLKYLTRLELGVNKHITNRVSNVNGMKYKYNANYWSYNIDWKNRLSYDIDVTKDFRITPYANLDVTYGKIFGINEDALTDPTLKLSVKPNSYFVITPRIGIDAKYDIELKNDMHISLKGNLEYHYDLNELYKRVNMARFSSVKDYYDLSIPGYRRSGLKVGGEVEIGKKDRYGVTFGATYDRSMKYSLRFNYKF
ncbi:autotransporter domain-containing protein [uncultured Sneathia sp.]|uniref:autotransporter domain-containing protein n=1 Tax=uncultured Sneathia sp. TaxID=278067 RepID=UPI002598609A|nr:autotransporter domain-containing protein [uncultured Sneathia sp.]